MIRFLLRLVVFFYQNLVSRFISPSCRFPVSCSNNMLSCLKKYNLVLGVFFGVAQILYCHPWGFGNKRAGSYDGY